MTSSRFCARTPTHDAPRTIRSVVEHVRAHMPDVVVMSNGSAEAGRETMRGIERDGLAHVVRREHFCLPALDGWFDFFPFRRCP